MIKRMLKGIGGVMIVLGVSSGFIGGLVVEDRRKNPIDYARDSYIIAKPGDSREKLFSQEGWTEKEIRNFNKTSGLLYIGDIVPVPQKDKPEELGNTGRKAYSTRKEAEVARGY